MDSGCSRHMTGYKSVLSDYHDEKGPSVTFGGNGKGLLAPGPAHLMLKKPKGLDVKHSNFRNCRHYGLNTHIASNCSLAPKAKKSAKGKKTAKTEFLAKATVPESSSVSTAADSSLPTNPYGLIVLWVPKKP